MNAAADTTQNEPALQEAALSKQAEQTAPTEQAEGEQAATQTYTPLLSPKVILITGCSSGIGLYCAQQLKKKSQWRVITSARRVADVEKLQEQGLEAVQLDLADSDSIHEALATVFKYAGRIDALFNNGAYGQPGAVEDLPREVLREQFETNVFGTQELTNAVLAHMRARGGGGRIIQNSSVLGYVALKYRGAYNASKYALEGLTDTMRLELKGSDIHMILIEPGPITSEFRANAIANFNRVFSAERIAASAHAESYKKGLASDDGSKPIPFNLEPDAVYQALWHALESKNPRLRYRITLPAKIFWWLKRLLPTAWLDHLLARF